MIKYLGLFFIAAILQDCEKPIGENKYTIRLTNNTSHAIAAYFALGGNYGSYYPDTLLPESREYVVSDIQSKSIYFYDSGIKWDDVFSNLPKDTLSIFLFHADTLEKYSWEKVRTKYKVLARYDLSLEDLQKLNFTVPYPPSDKMKSMQIFPPFQF